MESNIEFSKQEKKPRIVYEPTKVASHGDISTSSGQSIPDPLAVLKKSENPKLSEMIEALVFWIQERFGNEVYIRAHEEFQAQTGHVFYDDTYYHERMDYFLDQFIFQRILPESSAQIGSDLPNTPYNIFKTEYTGFAELSETVITNIEELGKFRHSVFNILKYGSNKLIVRDILTRTKIEVHGQGRNYFDQIAKPCIFQGFIFNFNGSHHLSQGLLMHSHKATRTIRSAIKKSERSKPYDEIQLFNRLAKQNFAFQTRPNMDIKTAYSDL